MGRPVVHFEIGCRDAKKTQEFYTKMFDWRIESMGPAAMIAPEGAGVGGHISALGHEPHKYTIFYVDVEDVAAFKERYACDRFAQRFISRVSRLPSIMYPLLRHSQ